MVTKVIPKPRHTRNVIAMPDLGWIAGVLDLKGRLIYKNNQQRATPQVTMHVESKNYDIIRHLCDLTGQNVELKAARPVREFMRRRCDTHCPEKHEHVGPYDREDAALPPIGRWTITGAGIAVMLESLLPYLYSTEISWTSLHRQMIDQAKLTGQGASAIHAQIRKLAMLGWSLPPEFMLVME